ATTLAVVFLLYAHLHHPNLYSFPTRRSSDLKGIFQMVDARRDGRPLLAVYLDHVKTRLHIVRMTLQPFLSRRDDARLLCRRYMRSEEHTSELQSRFDLVCRLLLEKKNSKHDE